MDLQSRVGNFKVSGVEQMLKTTIQIQTALSLRSLCHPDKIELFFLRLFCTGYDGVALEKSHLFYGVCSVFT